MAESPQWNISGEYMESCSCDYVCPCILTNAAGPATKDTCTFAMVFHIEQGRFGQVALDGLNFAMVGRSGKVMGAGNWEVGLIADQQANADQQQALGAICSGQAGGPPAAVAPLLGKFLGIEARPIEFQREGMRASVTIPGLLDQAIEGVAGAANPSEPLFVDNTMHPANPRLALAKAQRSHLHAFGLDWDDVSGQNNGHFAPFSWRSS